jgi:nicotinamide riboside kinase
LLPEANNLFFIDTDASTTYMFSMHYHGKADPRLALLAENTVDRYDIFFLCDTDIPYEDTWDRSGEVDQMSFQTSIRSDLKQRSIPFITLSGSLEERTEMVKTIVVGRMGPALIGY